MVHPPSLDPQKHALFLDFDGTLVDLVDDPQAVVIRPAALERLKRLQEELSGALAVVSGRRIADLDRFLAPLRFAAAGVHGLERRVEAHGEVERLAGPELLDGVRAKLHERLAVQPRLKLEDKGTSLVLHYRTAPELGEAAEAMMAEAVSGEENLTVMAGDHIVEAHPAGMDKGLAVAALMEREPFAGRLPVYAGDDVTDEFALRYVRERNGVSIKVGMSQTAAQFRLRDVGALHRWLGVAG